LPTSSRQGKQDGGLSPDDTVLSQEDLVEALECDYERDCTTLYKRLELKEYDNVMNFLQRGYWNDSITDSIFAQPDPVGPQVQVRTWVTRVDSSTGDVLWSQLPLHLAVVARAPVHVVKAILELYPQAVRCTDDQRMLPLHLSLRYGNNDQVVSVLLKQFPEAVNIRGGKGEGKLPVEYAVRGSNKALGDILDTFLGQTHAKVSKAASKSHSKELELLKAKLEDKESELALVKDQLNAIGEEKSQLKKLQEGNGRTNEIASVDSQLLANDKAELEKRISDLEKKELELKQSETQAKYEEQEIREELCHSMIQADENALADAEVANNSPELSMKEAEENAAAHEQATGESADLSMKQAEANPTADEEVAEESVEISMKQAEEKAWAYEKVTNDSVEQAEDTSAAEDETVSNSSNVEQDTSEAKSTEEEENGSVAVQEGVEVSQNMQPTQDTPIEPRSKKQELKHPSTKNSELQSLRSEIDQLRWELEQKDAAMKAAAKREQALLSRRKLPEPMVVNGSDLREKPLKPKRSLFGNRKRWSRVPTAVRPFITTKASI